MSDEKNPVLLGTFWKLNTMADGGVRIIFDMQCSLAEVASMGLVPGVPFAIARLEKGASVQSQPEAPVEPKPEDKPQPKAEVHSSNTNSRWIALRCKEPIFWDFLNTKVSACELITKEEEAAHIVRQVCQVDSRSKLDTDPEAEQRFHEIIRKPYIEFVRALETAR